MNVYEIVTEKILKKLEEGVIPWDRPWKCYNQMNLFTKIPYRGVNFFLLDSDKYNQPYWATFKQISSHGGRVKKGEKGSMVVFWKILENQVTNDDGDPKVESIPLLRYYLAWNVEQTEGLEKYIPQDEKQFNPIEEAESIVNGMPQKPIIRFGGNSACYLPKTDEVVIPDKSRFDNEPAYYSTMFHELVHSTGHEKRLNRKLTGSNFADEEKYSKEELIAEIGTCFLNAKCGIENTFKNSVSYIKSWLEALKNDKRMVVMASSQAQKAVEWILNIH